MSSPENGCEFSALGRVGPAWRSWPRVVWDISGDGLTAAFLPPAKCSPGTAELDSVVARVSEGVKAAVATVVGSCGWENPGAVEDSADRSPTLRLIDCISLASSSSLL